MKGIGKKTTVAFLSIVALLSVSGVISLFELGNLSNDTEEILSANSRDVEIARDLLRSAHSHSQAMMHVVIFGNEVERQLCNEALAEIDAHIASVRNKSSRLMQGPLDTLLMYSEELRRVTDSYNAAMFAADTLRVGEHKLDGREWYKEMYEPVYDCFTEQVQRYLTLSHSQLSPHDQLSKSVYRAVAPVLISLLVMIAVVLMFYYFVYVYGVKPILSINRSLIDHLSFKMPYKPKAEMVDQIKELSDNIETLINISKLNQK